ncbi:MAG: hypothetical protein A4E51_00434 [Methanosaeta sp. PtaU1.Bin055]|nr:MAG: hypothetical protein A4E51_00434 [Methanosaeta sp. PtaU1.Bin055]
MIRGIPTRNVLLASSILDIIIWNPAMIMKLTEYIRVAPITGSGITTKTMASFGRNARNTRIPPMAKAIRRLVAPVPIERPMLLEEVDWPIVPTRPPKTAERPSARIPWPTFIMSVLLQSASLIFWQVVMSPIVLRVEQVIAIIKGRRRATSKDHPK